MIIEDIFNKLKFTDTKDSENQILVGYKDIIDILDKDYLIKYPKNNLNLRLILADYLYYAEYQNRSPLSEIAAQKIFKYIFNDKKYSIYDKKNFWRNANWTKTNSDAVIDKVYLKKGYEARLVPIGSYIEDDYFFSSENPEIPKKVLSIHHPAHEVKGKYVYIRGQEFLEVGSIGLVRFYFNLNFNHPEFEKLLHELIRQFQTKFDLRSIPFYLKFFESNENQQYERADNFVVYTEKRHYKIVINLVLSIYSSLKKASEIYSSDSIEDARISIFRDTVPLFVKQIPDARGLGFAEEPNFGFNNTEGDIEFFDMNYSFGQKVCQILAESFWYAKDINAVYDKLGKNGVEKQDNEWLFYLNKGSEQDFYFDKSVDADYANSDTFLRINNIDEASWLGYTPFSNRKYLLAAIQIFYKILKEVIWIDAKSATLVGYSMKNDKKEYKIIQTNNFEEGLAGVNVFLQSIVYNYFDDNATKTLEGIDTFLKQGTRASTPSAQAIKNKTNFGDSNLDFAIEHFYFRAYGRNYVPNNYFIFGDGRKVDFNDSEVFKIADQIIETYLVRGLPFPNGYDGNYEFSPSLNFGLAGIGSFFLTLYDSSLPNYTSFFESTSSE
jgi:hypothetical protein